MTDRDRGETGKTGRTGETGQTGGIGRTGATGAQGLPGVSLTIEQLESYVRRLEGRYVRISRLLTLALVVVSVALLGTIAFTADGLGGRLDGQRETRRAARVGVCEAINETNRSIVDFLVEVSTPERVDLGRETFAIRDCRAEARRLAGGPR